MFISSIVHRIFGKKSKKIEIAMNEKKLLQLSKTYENFQTFGTPGQSNSPKSNAYELDLKLLKMRHQRNRKNVNPRKHAADLLALKSIRKTQHILRTKSAEHFVSSNATQNNFQIMPKYAHISTSAIVRTPTRCNYVFRRTPAIRRKKYHFSKL
uniref:Ribosomal protein S14 n=1 Tax=Panagrolaimus superbus TaxID=310955 RepID=A0A914YPQ4_9BILA